MQFHKGIPYGNPAPKLSDESKSFAIENDSHVTKEAFRAPVHFVYFRGAKTVVCLKVSIHLFTLSPVKALMSQFEYDSVNHGM